jgi:hypothetical protein
MVRSAGGLIVIDDYRAICITGTVPVYPHKTVPASWPAVSDDFKGCFIRMDHMGIIQILVQLIVDDPEIAVRSFHHPVCQGVGFQLDPIVFQTPGLPVKRQMVQVFDDRFAPS